MQKQQQIALSAIGLAAGFMLSASAFASPICSGQSAAVTGNVSTVNISPIQQQGQISLMFTAVRGGAVLFSDHGSINGQMVAKRGVRSRLNHQMIFSSGESLNTFNDVAITKLPAVAYESDGTPCAYNVVESINNFSGSGRFRDIKGAIVAEGTISFCSSNNQNTFILSGLVCLDD